MSEESDYCRRVVVDESEKHVVHSGDAVIPRWAASMLLKRERQSLRLPLEARIRELEEQVSRLKIAALTVVSLYETADDLDEAMERLTDLAEEP